MQYDDFFMCERRGCVNERATKRYCRDCQNKINARSNKTLVCRKKRGLCRTCTCKRMQKSSYCLYHFMKRVAERTAHDPNLGAYLYRKFLQQNKRCYYTGDPLVLGVNASLDHVHPQSKYPELRKDPRNLVWTTKDLNTCKKDLDIESFLHICESVVSNKDKIQEEYIYGT
jgi:hypothetical protein